MSRPLTLLVAPVMVAALAWAAQAEEQVRWAPSLQAAIETAANQNQLVLIHFWTPNCGPCRLLERNVFSRPDVAEAIHRDFVAVKINADAMPEIAERYKVDRWPMDVVVTPAGYPVHSMVSPQDPREYMNVLTRIASERRPGVQLANNNNVSRSASGAPEQNNFAQPPREGQGQSRFSQYSTEQVEQGDEGDRHAAGQSAPLHREYANPYVQPEQSPHATLASRPPYEAEQQHDPRSPVANVAPAPPRQTSNPYMNSAPPAVAPQGNPNGAGAPQASPARPSGQPPMGLDGYCPVTLVEQTKWTRGDARFGIVHRGHVYLFTSEAEKLRFWQDPDRYAPILSGHDPIAFAEAGQLVAGSRRHGVFFRNQIFMFSSEETLQRFWSSPQRYADVAYQAMRRGPEAQRR